MNKLNYTALVAINLIQHRANPGDVLSMIIRNEDTAESMYDMAKRLYNMFLLCYNFLPESIALHPDHIAIIKKQGKTIDVTISEAAVPLLAEIMGDLTTLPRRIPLVEDAELDLFTAVARYHFRKEDTKDFALAAIKSYFSLDKER